jgi:hypothetical protein
LLKKSLELSGYARCGRCAALFHREGAEPTQLDALAASQCGGDLANIVATISSASAVRRCGVLAASSAMSSALANAGSVLTAATRCTQHPPS